MYMLTCRYLIVLLLVGIVPLLSIQFMSSFTENTVSIISVVAGLWMWKDKRFRCSKLRK